MKLNKLNLIWLSILLLLMAACSKDNNFLQKESVLSLTLKGYNASDEELLVKLDTFKSSAPISGNSQISYEEAYMFPQNKNTVKLTVSEKNTDKSVFEKEVKKADGSLTLSFLYMDGKVSDMPEKPAVEAQKLKLIYMFIPSETGYTEPVDFVIGKYYITPQVFEELGRIKNVKPYVFSEPATISTFSTARQEYNGVMTSVISLVRICKAGTNVPYINGTDYIWSTFTSAPKPTVSIASSKLYIFSEASSDNVMSFSTRLDQ